MATARITHFEINDYDAKRDVFEIQFQTDHGWVDDDDHKFATLDDAKAWLTTNGHKLATDI